MSEPGIESQIADLVGSKKAFFTGLFDGTSDEVAFERSGSFISRVERIVAPATLAATARAEDVGIADDDAAEREVDAVVAAGDESADATRAAAPGTEPMPSADAIQRLLSGLSVQRTAGGGLVIEAPPEAASTLAVLFSGMAQLLQATATSPAIGGDPVAQLQAMRAAARIDVGKVSEGATKGDGRGSPRAGAFRVLRPGQ